MIQRIIAIAVVATTLLVAAPAIASAGYTYADDFCGHLHSSGYNCIDGHGDHTYGDSIATYNGAGNAAPLYAYMYNSSTGNLRFYNYDPAGHGVAACYNVNCSDQTGELMNISVAQYSGYAHTIFGHGDA